MLCFEVFGFVLFSEMWEDLLFQRVFQLRFQRLTCIIAAGIISRIVHTGWIVFDKYLGDALYAAMAYTLLSCFARDRTAWWKALLAMLAMTAIELFQLTMFPAQLAASPNLLVRIVARLLGTQFSFLDLFAYGIGILSMVLLDRRMERRPRS